MLIGMQLVQKLQENIELKTEDDEPLCAAINLSGYSGTNVHMIFEAPKQKQKSDELNAPYLFVLSAKNEISLKSVAQKYLDDISIFDENTLSEICYTLQTGRNHFEYRLAIKATTKEEIIYKCPINKCFCFCSSSTSYKQPFTLSHLLRTRQCL